MTPHDPLGSSIEVDHIDVFFVAPNDLAASMGQIGNMGHPEVQQTVDAAQAKIVQPGPAAGTLVNAANVERYTQAGVRAIMTSSFQWIHAGAKELMDRGVAGTPGLTWVPHLTSFDSENAPARVTAAHWVGHG